MTHSYRYLFSLPTLFRRIMTTNPRSNDYKGWSRDQLIERLLALEGPKSINAPKPSPPPPSEDQDQDQNKSLLNRPVSAKEFNFSNHPKRKIALKFCYSGWEYGGLAYQTGLTQLPTVEAVLFETLAKARLIDPEGGMEGCGWEKCGRTDKGVSAAGQVISLWVRSAIGSIEKAQVVEAKDQDIVKEDDVVDDDSGLPGLSEEDFGTLDLHEPSPPASQKSSNEVAKPQNELDYIAILNRLLPPTIRILAWAPVAPTFSARFSCMYRHYKYFFSSHSLDIPAMREAAARLVGDHDFRNLCKVDAQKQITVFRRVISRANIEAVDANTSSSAGGNIERGEGMYVFNLVGSAFLYHQVRHIMAILFLVGTGLEKPCLVTRLMNVAEGAENYDIERKLEVVNRKPEYQMADALPLMLWDCGYAEDDVKWRTGTLEPNSDPTALDSNDTDTRRSGSGTETDLYHQLHSIWNRSRIYTVLDRHFLQAAEKYHRPPYSPLPIPSSSASVTISDLTTPINYPLGGGTYKRAQKYVPVLERNRLDTVDMINERWRLGKGSRKAEKKGATAGDSVDDGDEKKLFIQSIHTFSATRKT
ncbi:pseudouridine synthase [Macrolepiota fuliginosa MF-IS2]|uniref:Pseudouridine synthase n=1 Tax=Macrolepiota fuliginosa MF-IS2 TaxID=1400762 RepID=A0A9P5X5J9_9AGAR|nr:pseudouridine synthase [Macrolepiota fuliginosa MF-IS2]